MDFYEIFTNLIKLNNLTKFLFSIRKYSYKDNRCEMLIKCSSSPVSLCHDIVTTNHDSCSFNAKDYIPTSCKLASS